MNTNKEPKTYSEAFLEGQNAVRLKPFNAPTNPYNDDDEEQAHNGWTDGAISAGISEIYTNGELDNEHK